MLTEMIVQGVVMSHHRTLAECEARIAELEAERGRLHRALANHQKLGTFAEPEPHTAHAVRVADLLGLIPAEISRGSEDLRRLDGRY